MAAKNSIKTYLQNSFYHLYNRGVEKRNIFLDDQDFKVFLSYLKTYLLPKDILNLEAIVNSPTATFFEKDKATRLQKLNNFFGELELHCFSLLPNHFHLLVRQKSENIIDQFLNSLCSRYARYFNKKYHRVGPLYQGVYKAVLVNSDEQLLHLSRYIHLNPFKWTSLPVNRYKETGFPSSFENYLGTSRTDWIKTDQILGYFKRESPNLDYFNFVNEYADPEFITSVALDFDD